MEHTEHIRKLGSFIRVIPLSVGGAVQGFDWKHGLPFIPSVVDMSSPAPP